MTLLFHELVRNRKMLVIFSVAVSFMLGICVIIYPEMAKEMDEISDLFANMGAFSDAFGMGSLNFGEFIDYFGIECGNTLGLGGAIFAAMLGISVLSKEEKGGSAEFLLTHPISRTRVVSEKLLSVFLHILIFNFCIIAVTVGTVFCIGYQGELGTVLLMILSHTILQLEIAAVTFMLSAFGKVGVGAGIGIAFGFYFVNILANITDSLSFLKYLTPFSYTDAAYIVKNGTLDIKFIVIGAAVSLVTVASSFTIYRKRDIT